MTRGRPAGAVYPGMHGYAELSMKPNLRPWSAGALVLALSAGAVLPAAAEDIEPPESATPVVGMAYGAGTPTLWLAGPRANEGTVVSADGDEVSFSADLESVQALAWRNDTLWVGDIGDPAGEREFVVVYRLGAVGVPSTTYFAYDFAYEDGPHHATAMMISGRGRIYIATAGEDAGIYRADLDPSRTRINTLYRVADAPAGVTDGVFLADGSTVALRTDEGIEYIDAFTWETLVTETIVGAPEGESIAVGPDDQILVGGNPTIRQTHVPSSDSTVTIAPSPSASPSPSPEASPSASPSASPEPAEGDPVDEPGPSRTGTLVALAVAAVVALAAGAVTFFVRS